MLVEDAKLLNDLKQVFKNKVLDIDIFANRCIELSVVNDQITFDKIIQVLNENNIEFDRNLLSRWIKYSRTSSNHSCSIDKLTSILRRATDPLGDSNYLYNDDENEEDEDSLQKSFRVSGTSFNFNSKVASHASNRGPSELPRLMKSDMKTKYLEKLKHALYGSLKQHAG